MHTEIVKYLLLPGILCNTTSVRSSFKNFILILDSLSLRVLRLVCAMYLLRILYKIFHWHPSTNVSYRTRLERNYSQTVFHLKHESICDTSKERCDMLRFAGKLSLAFVEVRGDRRRANRVPSIPTDILPCFYLYLFKYVNHSFGIHSIGSS